jgi:ribosomal-protein-alanine N-acetyltransferase
MEEENFIEFKCPYCAESVAFAGDFAGRAEECPHCAESLVIPSPGAEFGIKFPIPITTPTLVLRRFTFGDVEALVDLAADDSPDNPSYSSWQEEESARKWIESATQESLTRGDYAISLAIALLSNDRPIGRVSIRCWEPTRLQANLGLSIGMKYHQQGYGTEALQAVRDFCFDGIALHRVAIACERTSVAARKTIENAGLRLEGEFLEDSFWNGEWRGTAWYAMLESEYRSLRPPPPKSPP